MRCWWRFFHSFDKWRDTKVQCVVTIDGGKQWDMIQVRECTSCGLKQSRRYEVTAYAPETHADQT